MEYNYKSGSVVFFRSDLNVGETYGYIDFLSDMEDKLGAVWVIEEFDESDNTFTLKDDRKSYWYSIDMLVF